MLGLKLKHVSKRGYKAQPVCIIMYILTLTWWAVDLSGGSEFETKIVKPPGAASSIFRAYKVSNIVADALDPWVARLSTTVLLAMQDKRHMVLYEKRYQVAASSQYWEMIDNANTIFMFTEINRHAKVKAMHYKTCVRWKISLCRGRPLTRYIKLWFAYASGIPGTFSPPPMSKETAS